ncbi:MAG: hypothetical protein R3D90_16575 [Paracoccaceae bacterium]
MTGCLEEQGSGYRRADVGGAGRDTLMGGEAADVFVFGGFRAPEAGRGT